MLDFKCVINPYHSYTRGQDWDGTTLSSSASKKLELTLRVMVDLAQRLKGRSRHLQWAV